MNNRLNIQKQSQATQLNQLSSVFEILAKYSILCSEDKYIQKQNIAQLSRYEKPRQKRSQSLLEQVLERKSELQQNLLKRKKYMMRKF